MLSLPPDFAAAIAAGYVPNAIFVQADFVSGSLYLWSGCGPVTWNGQTWLGVTDPQGRSIASITPLRNETSEFRADNLTMSLSGVPSELVSKALDECRVSKTVKVWYGVFTNGAVVADPQLCFAGRMDVPTIVDDGPTVTISITVENRAFDLQQPREYRYTHEDQQTLYPGDLGFQFVQSIQQSEVWGRYDTPAKNNGPAYPSPDPGPLPRAGR
jgi:hypothetical protein